MDNRSPYQGIHYVNFHFVVDVRSLPRKENGDRSDQFRGKNLHLSVDEPDAVEPWSRLNHPYWMTRIVDPLWMVMKRKQRCVIRSNDENQTIQWIEMNSSIVRIIGNLQRWFCASSAIQRILERSIELSSMGSIAIVLESVEFLNLVQCQRCSAHQVPWPNDLKREWSIVEFER